MEETEETEAQKADADLINYDLKAILIHIGGAYGGHYHAYSREDLKEGVWNLQLPENFGKPAATAEEEEKEGDGEAVEAEEEKFDSSKLTKKQRMALAKRKRNEKKKQKKK